MNYIHPTAIIGPNVEMGDNNYIGPYCVIGEPAEHKGYWPTTIGENVIVQPIGLPGVAIPFSKKNYGKVVIGHGNVFTGFCTVDGGTEQDTTIGNNCFIMKRAHIGHDAHIHDDVIISPNCIVGGHVVVMQGANLGQAVCTHQYVVIGAYAMLGMGSVVPKRKMVEPFQTYAGNPIRHLGENKKMIHMADIKFLEQYNSYRHDN